MHAHSLTATILAALLAAAAPAGAAQAGAKPAATPAGATVHAHEPAGIPYEELEHHLGERVVVHTIYKSTRVGVLEKVSKVELTLSIPTPSGPAELTMPKDTVVRVTPAETPAAPKH
jgi:hypothetical protein